MSVLIKCTHKQGSRSVYNLYEFKSLASAQTFFGLVSTALFKNAYGDGILWENPSKVVPIDDFNYRFTRFIIGNDTGAVVCNVPYVKKTISQSEFENYVIESFSLNSLAIKTFIWCKFTS